MFNQPAWEQMGNFNWAVANVFGREAGVGYVVSPFSTNACKALNPDPLFFLSCGEIRLLRWSFVLYC